MWISSRYHSHSLMPLLGGRQLLLPILQAETGTFSEELFMLDLAGLCCPSLCPAPSQAGSPEASALPAHQLYTWKLWSHLLLGGGNQVSVL